MLIEKKGSIYIGRFPGLSNQSGLQHAVSTIRSGSSLLNPGTLNLGWVEGEKPSCVEKNRKLFFASLGIPVLSLAEPQQVHSDTVRIIDKPGHFPETDGLITRTPGIALSVKTADCVSLFIWDEPNHAIALVHAGWKGTVLSIAAKTIRLMKSELNTNPKLLQTFIGPSIGPCCFQVGSEVADRFSREHRKGDRVDLWSANKAQLKEEGIPEGSIRIAGLCTRCHPAWFFSHRASGGRAGRMMSVFMLK